MAVVMMVKAMAMVMVMANYVRIIEMPWKRYVYLKKGEDNGNGQRRGQPPAA